MSTITHMSSYAPFVKVEPIIKGWSEDQKYCVTTANGTKYFLRITPLSRYEAEKKLFAVSKQVAARLYMDLSSIFQQK